MTSNQDAHDMTPTEREATPTDGETTDVEPAAAEAAGAESEDGTSARSLLSRGAVALLGLTGLGSVSTSASANATEKHVLVVGYRQGRHQYEIETSGDIRKTSLAGPNDSINRSWGTETADGELRNWGVDSYAYTGRIQYVQGDGCLGFHFESSAFTGAGTIHIRGQAPGRHLYEMGTARGDIDLGSSTEYVDSDDRVPIGDGERYWTQDRVSGAVRGHKYDSYDVTSGDGVDTITVEQGNVQFYR